MKNKQVMKKNERRKKSFSRRFIWVLFAFLSINVYAQNISQSGTVVDHSNEAMIGVSVRVKGSSTGTITNLDGNFTITAPKGSVLEFSFMGYKNVEEKATGQKMLITLTENSISLDEIVIVPYGGSTNRKHSTGAGTLLTDAVIEQKNAIGVFDALQGAAPGLQIISNSGAPGSSSFVTMRGASTFSDDGVAPLYVVDGIIVDDIDNIMPSDIKRIDVMKDAATAAIYGARSANGVILITTKTGEPGKPSVDVRYQRSYYTVANKLPQVNAFESRLSMNGTQLASASTILEKFSARTDSVGLQYSTNYYYQDLLFQTGTLDDANVQISGGSSTFRYRTSLNYTSQKGIMKTSYNDKFSANINTDFNPWKDITFSTRIRLSKNKKNQIRDAVFQDAMRRDPSMIIWYPDGELIPYYSSGGQRNPIAELEQRTDETDVFQGNFFQGLAWNLTSWLKFDANLSANYSATDNVKFESKYLQGSETSTNAGSNQHTQQIKYAGEAYLNFYKSFANNHTVNAMIGSSFEMSNQKLYKIGGSDFITEELLYMNMAAVKDLANVYTTGWEESMASFFGRAMYSWKDRYTVNALIRFDGSSRFGENNRWGTFPSISAAWRFSDEPFMQKFDNILTDGKLRASYGVTGNDKIGRYESQTTYVTGSYYYNGVGGVVPSTKYGNPSLKWEETKQTNFGLDLIFLDGRISFAADYYIKKTSDLLSDMNLPYTTGYNNIRVNLASIENKGMELSLTAIPLRMKDFTWLTTVNWWKNKNKITELSREDYVANSNWLVAKGRNAGIWYGYKNMGVYAYNASNAWSSDYSTLLTPVFKRDAYDNVVIGLNGQPTLVKYLLPNGSEYNGEVKQMMVNGVIAGGGDVIWYNKLDENGAYDGVIDSSDKTELGSANPSWYASWSNSLNYKNFSLSFNFYLSWGGKIWNDLKRYYCSWGGNTHKQSPEYIMQGWKYPGEITTWYALDSRARSTNNQTMSLSDQFLENGTFLRLQNLRFSYALERKFLQNTPMRSVQVYLYGNNLLTWTNYTGFDPELGGSVLTPGKDSSVYPKSREFGFGFNVGF